MIVDPLSICTNGFIVNSSIESVFAIASGGISYAVSVVIVPPNNPNGLPLLYGGGSGGVSGGTSKTVTKKSVSKYKNRSSDNTKITVTCVKDGEELKKIIYVKKANVTVDDIKLSLVENKIKINVKR